MSDFVIENGVLKKYTGEGGDVVIPEGVKEIGEQAFIWSKSKKIIVPPSVTKIGETAFMFCENLEDIVLPESIVEIGNNAFNMCKNLQSVSLPKNITTIEGHTFCDCENLKEITIPEDVVKIGFGAFRHCGLNKVIVPKKVSVLEKECFANCSKLQTISVWNTLKESIFAKETFFDNLTRGLSLGVVIYSKNKTELFAFTSKIESDNFTDFISKGKWNEYDLDIINNGPYYKYKLPARLLGALGRLKDPVDLTDECKELYVELLVKNAKKLIPIAEEIDCPEIIEMMIKHEIINGGNKKAINKLLKASANEKIAAFAE